jgi:signal transduction histidine kinase
MKVSSRLYLTVTPAVLGVLALAGLAYWGDYARQAPELLIVIALVTAVVSLIVAWLNARFLAQRIERLAGVSASAGERLPSTGGVKASGASTDSGGTLRGVVSAVAPGRAARLPDEIDAIEHALERLSRAVGAAQSDQADGRQSLEERVKDHARLLAAVADDANRQLDDVRLPLHILLDNRFGELNENQEEMLGSARTAAEAIEADLASLRRIAELDLGEREMRRERLRPADLIEGIRPVIAATAEARDATLTTDVAPLLPFIAVDRVQLQEALTTLFKLPIANVESGTALTLTVNTTGIDASESNRAPFVEITLRGGHEPRRTIHSALASRVVAAHGGRVAKEPGLLRIVLPTEHGPH